MDAKGGSATIKPIHKADVHRICSGQVILDLASAVKELVENSLDAGANSIEVRLKEYGGESFEVGDNGFGISPNNYQSATLKYHTSKISDFSDLQSLRLFGFRGEALSSLCALGNVTIETRTKYESVGTQLMFDHSGLIISQNNIARQIGTTVTVAKLFSPLPVRYKEFHRNIRREYSRLLSLLHAYALIAKGVRLVCTNVAGRNAKIVVLQTQGTGSVKDNIITVFGTKTLASLDALDFCISDGCRIEGFVSKPGSGSGRASGDRQFFFVNGRPVDMPKVTKLLNERYKSYNSQQYPMAVLNFILPTTTYDVNVTPDKRKIFLHDEGLLMSALREALENFYAPDKYVYAINNFESSSQVREACISLVSAGNAEKLEPIFTEDYELAENVNSKVNLFLNDGSPSSRTEELLQESKEDAMHEDNTENQKVDDAMTESISDTCERKTSRPLADFVEFKCGTSVSEYASPLKQTKNQKFDDAMTDSISDTCEPKTRTPIVDFAAFNCGSSVSEFPLPLKQANSSLVGAEKSSMVKTTKTGLKDLGLIPNSRRVQSKLTGFITPNKRQHEEGSLLSEEPVLKKWMFCADENAKRVKKENSKGSLLGFCSEKDACSVRNLSSKNEDENDFPAIEDLSENITHVESCNEPAKDQRENMQDEGDQGAGDENAVYENLEMTYQEDNVGMVSSSMQMVDGVKVSRTDETIGTTLMSDVCLDDKDDIERRADNKDIRIAQFDINRCRLKSSRGLLRHDINIDSWQKDKRCKKSCYTAATLAKSSAVEDGKEKEAALSAATRELERSFNKEDFKKMKVIGQFNLGFIIGKLDEDLFIVDQHASDEKYNFEHLCRTTILNRQPLLRPLALEISAAEEVIISTHMDIFRRNGFDFIEDTSAPPGRRLLLSSVPYSKNITFGVGDVQELISILVDEPMLSTADYSDSLEYSHPSNNSCKKVISRSVSAICPSRVRAMLASRACRKSVMIGDALSKKGMET
ncbi:hypothetical protein KI387_030998, partial [Taxus chinensis]